MLVNKFMDWRRLQVFNEIANFNSFTQAAENLKKSQSTLSRDILFIEKRLGFKVFNRNIRGIKLTKKGFDLLLITREFFNKIQSFK